MKRGTSIYAFEYVQLQGNFDPTRYQGKWAITGGTIKAFQYNPNVSKIWVMRIYIKKGLIELEG